MPTGLTRTIETRPVTGSGLVTDSSGLTMHMLLGMQFTENAVSAAPARVLLRNGNGGDIYIDIRLLAGQSMEESYDLSNYYRFTTGIYVDVAEGTVRGSVRCRRSAG